MTISFSAIQSWLILAVDCLTEITDSNLSGVEITDCKLEGMTVDGFNICELIEFYKNNHKED